MPGNSNRVAELVRYGLVGGASAATYFLGSNFLDQLGLSPWASAGTAWCMSLFVSYFGHMRVTFKVAPDHRRMVSRYVVLCCANLALTEGVTYLVHGAMGYPYAVASAAVTVLVPLMSYPASKFWVFA